MNPKVKVFFVFLAVSAILSVFSFFDILSGVRSALIHETAKPIPLDITQDADQDGLSDADESYWDTDFQNPDSDGDGFLDGEEVASGNDPREKATHPQGDSLENTVYGTVEAVNTDDINFTDKSGELLAGAITTGDISNATDSEKTDQYLDSLSLSVLEGFDESQNNIALPTINIVSNSKENQVKYLEDIAQIIKNDLLDFSSKLNIATSLEESAPFFSAKSIQYKSSFEKAGLLEIPEGWVDIHKNILTTLNKLHKTYTAIGKYDEDVLKSLMALNDLTSINIQIKSIIESVQLKISDEKLTLNNNFYQILNLLFKDY